MVIAAGHCTRPEPDARVHTTAPLPGTRMPVVPPDEPVGSVHQQSDSIVLPVLRSIRFLKLECCAAVSCCQVRLIADGGADASMNAGRCPMTVGWTAGLDDQGQLQALKIDVTLVVS